MTEKDYLYDLLVHDLGSPLSVVTTTLANLLGKTDRYGDLTDRQRHSLERVLRNARKAQKLLREIVEVARCEEHLFKADYFFVEASLKEALTDILEVMESEAFEKTEKGDGPQDWEERLKGHGITVTIAGEYAKTPFFHDKEKVEHVLKNLMSNALKYRRERMDVSLSGEDELVVSVSDDGMGIPEEKQADVYKRFVRLRSAETEGIPGLGLGLYCVRHLLGAMNGDITFSSREGFGTCFTVRIPSLNNASKKGGADMAESILNGKRILAVDDEPDVLSVLQEEIMDACPKCTFEKATTYETANEMLKSKEYDVVILDIMGVRGFDLLDTAVQRNFKVAMLTAHALTPEALKRSHDAGARAYLPKDKLGEIVPFLEDILKYEYNSGWRRLLDNLENYFDNQFDPEWKKTAGINYW
jgi:CheY-like chemotaxis protein